MSNPSYSIPLAQRAIPVSPLAPAYLHWVSSHGRIRLSDSPFGQRPPDIFSGKLPPVVHAPARTTLLTWPLLYSHHQCNLS